MLIKHAVNPARLVSAQAFSLVANGNVVSGTATAMRQLQPGTFSFETKRPTVCVCARADFVCYQILQIKPDNRFSFDTLMTC
jgi:hypothetical protein